MDPQDMTSQAPPMPHGRTGLGESRHGGWDDLALWVAQLDATQRQAYAARVQDRLRVLDRILELVVNAKREGRLCYGHDGSVVLGRALSNGGVPTPGKGLSNAASSP
jgi:hypothetical protein